MNQDNSDNLLDEPPRHDMLTVKFRGDSDSITLPYCEVANGLIDKIDPIERHISITGDVESTTLTYEAFIKIIEETFDIKELVLLSLQKANSYDNIQIL